MGAPLSDIGPYITARTLAAAIGAAPVTIYRMFDAKDLPGLRIGRAVRIPRQFQTDLMSALQLDGNLDVGEFGRAWQHRQAQTAQPAQIAQPARRRTLIGLPGGAAS